MRDAIDLFEKNVEIDNIIYKITNVNFVTNNNNFYAELEYEGTFLNMLLKDLLPHITEQIKPNGSYKKKRADS
jgi:hypothetical protein